MSDKYPYPDDVVLPSASEFNQRVSGKWSDYDDVERALRAKFLETWRGEEPSHTAPLPLALENQGLERDLAAAKLMLDLAKRELEVVKMYLADARAIQAGHLKAAEALAAKLLTAEELAAKGLEFAKANDLLVDENEDLKATVAYLKDNKIRRCLSSKCPNSALSDSNYCHVHREVVRKKATKVRRMTS